MPAPFAFFRKASPLPFPGSPLEFPVEMKCTKRQHNIKKLVGVDAGDGQWRIRSGIYRLRL
jgi:hypothetical protein